MGYSLGKDTKYDQWLKGQKRGVRYGDIVYWSTDEIVEQIGIVTCHDTVLMVQGDRQGRFHVEKEMIRIRWTKRTYGGSSTLSAEESAKLPCLESETLVSPDEVYSWTSVIGEMLKSVQDSTVAAKEALDAEKLSWWTTKGFMDLPELRAT